MMDVPHSGRQKREFNANIDAIRPAKLKAKRGLSIKQNMRFGGSIH